MKERYSIEIADIQLTILSDEPKEYVESTVAHLDETIRDMTVKNKRCSKLDAAILCALDFYSEKTKADKKIKNLEAQISLYDVNIRRLREEIISLKQKAGEPLDETDLSFVRELKEANNNSEPVTALDMDKLGEMLRAAGDENADNKIRSLEKYLEARKQGDKEGQTREDKLRYIESLLRGGSDE